MTLSEVIATNAGGDSPPSTSACLTTLPNAPAAPTGLTPAAGSAPSTEIDLSWTGSAGATDYKVERCTGAGSGCTPTTEIVATFSLTPRLQVPSGLSFSNSSHSTLRQWA